MKWWKTLSVSDAQQPTEGRLMPFRFTSENCPGDFVTWFRNEFFCDVTWNNTSWGQYELEEAHIKIAVTILGVDLGIREMRLTHAIRRNQNHGAPTTYLYYDDVIQEYLQDNNMTGKYIIFTKDSYSNFCLTIEQDRP